MRQSRAWRASPAASVTAARLRLRQHLTWLVNSAAILPWCATLSSMLPELIAAATADEVKTAYGRVIGLFRSLKPAEQKRFRLRFDRTVRRMESMERTLRDQAWVERTERERIAGWNNKQKSAVI